jgi:cation transport ATPase
VEQQDLELASGAISPDAEVDRVASSRLKGKARIPFCGSLPRSSAAQSIPSAKLSSKAQRRAESRRETADFTAIPGHGVSGRVEGPQVLLGNAKLMRDRGVPIDALLPLWERLANDGKTPMYVAADGQALGLVAVADTVKRDSKAAIETLIRLGIEVVMLTGDNGRTAKAIANQVGIQRTHLFTALQFRRVQMPE